MGTIRGAFLSKSDISTQLLIDPFRSLIMSLLLYILHIVPISDRQNDRRRKFYSKCIRIITKRFYDKTAKQENNVTLRRNFGIPAIGSIGETYRLRMYYKWKTTLSISHVNDSSFIEAGLETLNYALR